VWVSVPTSRDASHRRCSAARCPIRKVHHQEPFDCVGAVQPLGQQRAVVQLSCLRGEHRRFLRRPPVQRG